MDQTVRLLRLVTALQQRPEWPGDELAELLDVTPRTVRRDVTRLRDLGYAVEAVPGRGGGYRLRAGQALPPLVLSEEEVVVLVVGLRTAAAQGLSGADGAALAALAKLEQLLPSRLRTAVAALGQEVVQLGAAGSTGTDPTTLAELAVACVRREVVALSYTDHHGRTTRRDVGAARIVQVDRRWYLVAHDIRKRAWRTFRVDRIARAQRLGGRAELPDPPDPAELVAESVAVSAYGQAATVRLEMPLREAQVLVRPGVGRLEADGPDATVLRIGADDLEWLAAYLVGMACAFEVLDPPELLEAVRALGRRLAATGPVVRLTSSPAGGREQDGGGGAPAGS